MANATTLQSEMQGDAPVTVTRTKIHWGRVLKGAAIITAIAVAAVVVGLFAHGFFTALLTNNPALAGAAATTGAAAKSIFMTVANGIGIGLTAVGDFLGGMFTQFFPSLAGVNAAATGAPGPTAKAVGNAMGTVAAGAAATIGGFFAIKHATVMPMVTTEHHTMTPNELSSYQATKTALKTTELAHHAAEHTQHSPAHHPQPKIHSRNWADRVTPANAAVQASISPRSASFTEQLNKEAAAPISAEAKR
jgi:hypothetical protein